MDKKLSRGLLYKDNKELRERLINSKIKSRRVVGGGALTMDISELKNTEEFKDYLEKGYQIVQKNRKAKD